MHFLNTLPGVSVGETSARRFEVHRWIQNVAAYALGVVIVWWVGRGLSPKELIGALVRARLSIFVPVALGSVVLWIVGDGWLYARLFSYFHVPTRLRELLPGIVAHEFLQAVNGVAAGTSVALFVQRRKGVKWIAAGCTLAFQGFLDVQLLAAMAVLASLFAPQSTFGLSWRGPAVVLGGCMLFAGFWIAGRPRIRLARWVYERPWLATFREARLAHCLSLTAIRALLFTLQAPVLYLEMLSFGIHAPAARVAAAIPAVMIAGAVPLVPSGLGPRQAAIVAIFEPFGSRASLLAMALAHTGLVTIARLGLGFWVTGMIAQGFSGGRQPGPSPRLSPRTQDQFAG
jgi:uncharacterized membrane protein YbhN (UPF0104 family)